jgi:uncharacterized SAM-binding protein YcdF (DUF218 family)
MPRRQLLLVTLLFLAAGITIAVRDAGRFLVVADPLPPHADAIVMLAGSLHDRALETARLQQLGLAPRVVLTRAQLPRGAAALRGRGVRMPEEHELAIAALGALGVPASTIEVVRRRAHSTPSEARAIARWACRRGLHSLIVVTSPPHTRRARLILRRALGPGVELAVRPSPAAFFPADHWWRQRRAMKDVLTEYQKLAAYWLVERWSINPCGGLGRRTGGTPSRLSGLADHRRQLALGVQLAHDVAAADELAAHEELGNRRPAGVRLHAFALVGLGEDVDGLEGHADLVQHLDGGSREAAHRKSRCPLHVDDDRVLFHFTLDVGQHVAHRMSSPRGCVRSCSAWIRGMSSPRAA